MDNLEDLKDNKTIHVVNWNKLVSDICFTLIVCCIILKCCS